MFELFDITLFILSIIIIFLLYKTFDNSEKFSTTTNPIDINTTIIQQQYESDNKDMIDIALTAKNILSNNDSYNLTKNSITSNNITINGTIKTNYKSLTNILPKFIIIAYANEIVPMFWAPCDGYYYILNSDNNATRVPPETDGCIQTPDLAGRFVLGQGQGSNLTPRDFSNPKGGFETVTLTIDNMPSHNHQTFNADDNCFKGGKNNTSGSVMKNGTVNTGTIGDDSQHNNMPPFLVLKYIMKL
jgi:microcystin-dependent protein